MATNTKQYGPKGVRHQRIPTMDPIARALPFFGSMPVEDILVLWQFETNTHGAWQNMDRATSDLLEIAFQERPDGEITIHWGEWLSYDYNFRDMWQQRYDGSRAGRDRNIRRSERRLRQWWVRQGECVNWRR